MGLNIDGRQRAKEALLKYIERHPGCLMQDIVADEKYTSSIYTQTEMAKMVDDMVDDGRLERWYSGGVGHFYIPRPHTSTPTTKPPEKHDRHITAYLDAFDEFCDEMMERYDADVIGNLSTEAMISLYRGFLTALPDMEKAGERK